MKLTRHFKERYASRGIEFKHIEHALRSKPKKSGKKLIYISWKYKVKVITDLKTETLITCIKMKKKTKLQRYQEVFELFLPVLEEVHKPYLNYIMCYKGIYAASDLHTMIYMNVEVLPELPHTDVKTNIKSVIPDLEHHHKPIPIDVEVMKYHLLKNVHFDDDEPVLEDQFNFLDGMVFTFKQLHRVVIACHMLNIKVIYKVYGNKISPMVLTTADGEVSFLVMPCAQPYESQNGIESDLQHQHLLKPVPEEVEVSLHLYSDKSIDVKPKGEIIH